MNLFVTKITYKIYALIVLIGSSFIFFFRIFEFRILNILKISNISNETISKSFNDESSYLIIQNEIFTHSVLIEFIHIASFVVRDFFYIIILMIFSGLIFTKVDKAMKYKRYISYNSRESETNIEQTYRVIAIMVIVGNMNSIFGRTPILINLVLEIFIQDYGSNNWDMVFTVIAVFAVYFSFFILQINILKIVYKIFSK